MKKLEEKRLAQDLIMKHMSAIGYGSAYDEFVKKVGDQERADEIMMSQMNRVAKIFGFESAWFS